MDTPKVKETDYLKAWALLFVCATIGGGIAGALAGGLLGGILGAAGTSTEKIGIAGAVAGFIVALPISYLMFRFFVSRFIVLKLTTLASRNTTNAAFGLPQR